MCHFTSVPNFPYYYFSMCLFPQGRKAIQLPLMLRIVPKGSKSERTRGSKQSGKNYNTLFFTGLATPTSFLQGKVCISASLNDQIVSTPVSPIKLRTCRLLLRGQIAGSVLINVSISITFTFGNSMSLKTLKCLSLVTIHETLALTAQSANLLSSGSAVIRCHL